MAGMTELPTAQRLAELGFEAEIGERLATVRHAITNRRITQHVHAATIAGSRRRRRSDPWRFVHRGELTDLPLTAATVKSLIAAGLLPAED